jgi:hypothetical protein
MSFFGNIFGTTEATNKVIDTVANGLDKIWYTDEEKAADESANRREAGQFLLGWMDTTKGQNIARRALAILLAGIWSGMFVSTLLLKIVAVWTTDPEIHANLITSAEMISEDIDQMTGAMMLILGFYFAAPHLDKIVEGAMSKFGRQEPAVK